MKPAGTAKAAFESPLRGYNKYGGGERRAAQDVLANGKLFFPHGSYVRALSERLAAEYGAAGCTLVSSGTAAIHVGLGAFGVDFGDEVITTPLTDTGTVLPIFYQGAVPVFADVDPRTMMITAATIEPCITRHTRAIIVVHYGGFAADMAPILELAGRHGIAVIEDSSQAQGTLYQGSPIGVLGDAGCFSTNDTKLVSCGDGGFVLTRDAAAAHRARLFHDKGFDRSTGIRDPEFVAPNYRLTEIQAAILDEQWSQLEERVRRRRAFAQTLDSILARLPGVRPLEERPGDRCSYFSYLFQVEAGAPYTRDELVSALRAAGAPAHKGNLFDVMYRLKIFHGALPRYMSRLSHPDYASALCPAAERAQSSTVRLEMCETYAEAEVEIIASALSRLRSSTSTSPGGTASWTS